VTDITRSPALEEEILRIARQEFRAAGEALPAAARRELEQLAGGMLDAMAMMILVMASATKTKHSKLIAALRIAAGVLKEEGKLYAAEILESACKRVERAGM
jgi:hypothetical protein